MSSLLSGTLDYRFGSLVAILSYDEKPGIQAIGNTAPDLPPVPGRYRSVARDHEDKRHGSVPNRFEFTFTPKHGSWLNLIEVFFSKLARTLLRGIRVGFRLMRLVEGWPVESGGPPGNTA